VREVGEKDGLGVWAAVVWHTQGSGKIVDHGHAGEGRSPLEPGLLNPIVVLVTDRVDLGRNRSGKTFHQCGKEPKPGTHRTASGGNSSRTARESVITTVIDKFDRGVEGGVVQRMNRPNIFVLVDEESPAVFTGEDGGADEKRCCPTACFHRLHRDAADEERKKSTGGKRFGGMIQPAYTINPRAVKDKAVVCRCLYEGRLGSAGRLTQKGDRQVVCPS